jgi:hypothetical protein
MNGGTLFSMGAVSSAAEPAKNREAKARLPDDSFDISLG